MSKIINKKPVWFLDVDGVINVLPYNPTLKSQPYHKVWDNWAITNVLNYTITYSPDLIDEINRLSEVVDIHWLTTWQSKAAINLAPALGLKNFSVADADGSNRTSETFFVSTVERWWKLNAVIEDLEIHSRPVIWTDDDINNKTVGAFIKTYSEDKNVPLKTMSPFSFLGLEPHHIKNIGDFARNNSTPNS